MIGIIAISGKANEVFSKRFPDDVRDNWLDKKWYLDAWNIKYFFIHDYILFKTWKCRKISTFEFAFNGLHLNQFSDAYQIHNLHWRFIYNVMIYLLHLNNSYTYILLNTHFYICIHIQFSKCNPHFKWKSVLRRKLLRTTHNSTKRTTHGQELAVQIDVHLCFPFAKTRDSFQKCNLLTLEK